MRLYFNSSDFGYTVASISEIYYDEGEARICFCNSDGDWFKILDVDYNKARSIFYDILCDGFLDVSSAIAYPFEDSDFLEE